MGGQQLLLVQNPLELLTPDRAVAEQGWHGGARPFVAVPILADVEKTNAPTRGCPGRHHHPSGAVSATGASYPKRSPPHPRGEPLFLFGVLVRSLLSISYIFINK